MSWKSFFDKIQNKDYFKNLNSFLDEEYRLKTIYPPRDLIFNAFNLCDYENVKVVILGQDPYHEKGQAMGLCFSVPENITLPPSLRNIYKEIENEYNVSLKNKNGDLTYLAKQGVLLLNPILTVEEGKPLSHKIKEYELFINDVFNELENKNDVIIYLLWGGKAKVFKKLITNKNHFVLEANHPSPLSANRGGWFNSNIFKNCNKILEENNIKPIEWF